MFIRTPSDCASTSGRTYYSPYEYNLMRDDCDLGAEGIGNFSYVDYVENIHFINTKVGARFSLSDGAFSIDLGGKWGWLFEQVDTKSFSSVTPMEMTEDSLLSLNMNVGPFMDAAMRFDLGSKPADGQFLNKSVIN